MLADAVLELATGFLQVPLQLLVLLLQLGHSVGASLLGAWEQRTAVSIQPLSGSQPSCSLQNSFRIFLNSIF